MNVGKAIYYLLANNANVSAITTRIYPEFAPPDATTPFIAYTISNVQPDDTHDGPAVIDEVRMDVICVDDTYDGAADLASVVRVALDRVYGTYNTVNVESIQFTDANIEVRDTPRQYGQDLTFIVRVKRDDVQIATGSPIEALNLWRLADVDDEIVNALDRQALVYDEATSQWIADGVGQVVIPVRNPDRDPIAIGTVLKATGAQGDRILVAPFNADLDDPRYLVGIASEELGATAETKDGHAQVYGELRDIDTNAYEVGDVLYPDSTGALVTTENQYPIAIVLRKQENTGRIFIRTWTPGRSRYDADAETLRQEMDSSLANADIELYFSAQADGYGLVESPGSDSVVNSTPAEDYQVERAIFYNNTGLASYISDSGWSTLTTNTESYAAAKARVEDYIRGGTYGKLPCTFAIVRTEELSFTGLLDSYSGASAAYSLRLLRRAYKNSPAIRVRRASDNAEQDIGFDGNGDLDTTSLISFGQGEVFVKTWYDQSGNSNDATQTTTGSQPQICTARTNLLLQSNQFGTSPWGNSNTTNTAGQIGYDGTSDAWLATVNGGNQIIGQNVSGSGIQTVSVYAKGSVNNGLRIFAFGDDNVDFWFNLNTGGVDGSVSPKVLAYNIENAGSGWYRCSFTFTQNLSSIYFYITDNNRSNASSGSIYIQDAQLETGSSATDYIETTTSAVSVSEVITENGKPALRFDGVNDNIMSVNSVSSQNITMVTVANAVGAMLSIIDTYNDGHELFHSSASAGMLTNSTDLIVSISMLLQRLVFATYDGSTQKMSIDSAESTQALVTTLSYNQPVTIGQRSQVAANFLIGKVQEVLVYESDQSANRTGIESNINTYYSIY